MMKSFLILSLQILICCFSNLSCSLNRSKYENFESEKTEVAFDNTSKTSISEGDFWNASTSIVRKNTILTSFQKIDENAFFILDIDGTIYKTIDKGKTWKSTKIPLEKNQIVTSIAFSNSLFGVISVVKSPQDLLDIDNLESQILETKDGGLTWKKTFKIKSGRISKIIFDLQGVGWAVGSKGTGKRSIDNIALLLRTDKNKNWIEINTSSDLGGLVDISITKNQSIILTGNTGQILLLDTTMQLRAYNGVEKIKSSKITISKTIITESETFFVFGRTGGREGTNSAIFYKNKLESNWEKLIFQNLEFTDVDFLTPNTLIACGFRLNKSLDGTRDKSEGIVLQSLNGGKDWVILYKKENSEFSKLTTDNGKNIWLIDSGGNFTHLRKTL